MFDARDMSNIYEVGTGDLPGDLDTLTPYGNIAVLSVDDEAEDGIASMVMPWSTDVDTTGPVPLFVTPVDGATNVPLSSRIGIGFNEMIEPTSIFPGSIQLLDENGNAVEGWASAQENTAYFTPKAPLKENTQYTIRVMEGGARDVNNNAISTTLEHTFQTLGTP